MAFQRIGTLREIVDVPVTDWRDIQENLVESIREHVRNRKYFKTVPYNADYALAKTKGQIKSGVGQYRSGGVNLSLSGKMLDSIQTPSPRKDGFTIGWIGAEAAKVEGNADRGRAISTPERPLIPPVEKELYADVDQLFGARCKLSSSTTNINLKT